MNGIWKELWKKRGIVGYHLARFIENEGYTSSSVAKMLNIEKRRVDQLISGEISDFEAFRPLVIKVLELNKTFIVTDDTLAFLLNAPVEEMLEEAIPLTAALKMKTTAGSTVVLSPTTDPSEVMLKVVNTSLNQLAKVMLQKEDLKALNQLIENVLEASA